MTSASARILIDLDALADNYRVLAELCRPGETAAVVKADAYGLGAGNVVQHLLRVGCRSFFVATAEEGRAVRDLTTEADIYVLAGPTGTDQTVFLQHSLIPVLNDAPQLERWQANSMDEAPVLHVDTGMSRLGLPWDQPLPRAVRETPPRLLMTHLACADEPDHPLNRLQLERFEAFCRGFPDTPVSIGNSAGVLLGQSSRGDLTRPGIALYGANPLHTTSASTLGAKERKALDTLRPVVTFEAEVLQMKTIRPGESIGYGATRQVNLDTTLAVVGAGYADGLPRLLSNRGWVAWRDTRLPILGRVSMDFMVVDATPVKQQLRPGDWLELFGTHIAVEDVAEWAETISYEILTGLGQRPERVYLRQ